MGEHYFSEEPSGPMLTREVEVRLAGAPRSLVTAGGVFSPEHLDRGTELLLDALEDEPELDGNLLDLGCGWGPIALTAALRHPKAVVWAVDVNGRARELTATNAERLGLSNLRTAAPEAVPDDVRFAAIHSNPPIRIGKQALHELLLRWLPRLQPGGSAHLVVAKHLGAESLSRWIAETIPGLSTERVDRRKGFHVIRALREADERVVILRARSEPEPRTAKEPLRPERPAPHL